MEVAMEVVAEPMAEEVFSFSLPCPLAGVDLVVEAPGEAEEVPEDLEDLEEVASEVVVPVAAGKGLFPRMCAHALNPWGELLHGITK